MKFTALFILVVIACVTMIVPPAMAQATNTQNPTATEQPSFHPPGDILNARNMEAAVLAQAKAPGNGEVQYISKSISASDMKTMDAEESAYNLKILFVSKGVYLSGVGVSIMDSKGNSVLNTVAKDPVLLVKMLPGEYTASTKTNDGSALTQRLVVGNGHLALYVLRYPAEKK